MVKFISVLGPVELTDERRKHILQFHPDTKKYQKHFQKTLKEPKNIRRSRHDPKVFIFYGLVEKEKYLAIVVKTNERHFILTAYLTKKSKKRQ